MQDDRRQPGIRGLASWENSKLTAGEKNHTQRHAISHSLPAMLPCWRLSAQHGFLFSQSRRNKARYKFYVKASVALAGKFRQWECLLF